MNKHTRFGYSLTAIAAALLAAFGPAYAAEGDEIAELTKPTSSVQGGIGYVDKDNGRFGQYNGLNEKGGYGLLDLDYVNRDDATGRWLRFRGSNLGLDHRDLRFEHEIQGNWGYYIDFSQIPRHEPYMVNTAITGIGTPTPTVPTISTAGGPVRLKTERDRLGLGFSKNLPGNWDLQVTFRNEEKDGARVFGRGTTTGTTFEFLPEPINSTTRQIEAMVNYTGERLQLSGGYYGTMYDNEYKAVFVTGGSGNLTAFNPTSLPPDNQSHQLYLSGGYNFTPTTRGSFKVSYGRATQDDAFLTAAQIAPTPVQPGVPGNLDGRIDTTLAQFGLTARPMPKLSVRASLRYEDRDDKTPLFQYGTGGTTWDGFNEPRSTRTASGKLEASYALPMGFRLTGGVDYDEKKRNTSPLRVVTFREKTEETAYRAELRRSMSETITGAVAYIHSERDGSPFIVTTPAASGNRVAPIHLADRDRDQVRVTINWEVADPLSLQFRVDRASDDYAAIHPLGTGPRKGEARNYSVDASLRMSERWQATAWASRNETEQEQVQHAGSGTAGLVWAAALESTGNSFGLGLRGKPVSRLEIGGDLSQSDIEDKYGQQRIGGTATVVNPLPDINTRLTRVQLFAKYELRKNSGVRVDYVYDRYKSDDWTWTTWTYTDGTTLTQAPVQKVNFVGVSYYYRWQ
jgi:MtrB/PioB family decaheme-associated outer membrane protein